MNQYNMTIARKIMELRKVRGFTQEQLADKLGVTFQAVSKWENSISSPDINLIPRLAQEFGISIDELFGKESDESQECGSTREPLDWEDDGQLRVVVYKGNKLMAKGEPGIEKLVFEYKGDALNIHSQVTINCGDIKGNANAGTAINCGDINGNVSTEGVINCGDIDGSANAGGSINCGDIDGSVNAEGSINCGDIDGDVIAIGNVSADDIKGNVKAGNVKCEEISGDVEATEVVCESIKGNTYSAKM